MRFRSSLSPGMVWVLVAFAGCTGEDDTARGRGVGVTAGGASGAGGGGDVTVGGSAGRAAAGTGGAAATGGGGAAAGTGGIAGTGGGSAAAGTGGIAGTGGGGAAAGTGGTGTCLPAPPKLACPPQPIHSPTITSLPPLPRAVRHGWLVSLPNLAGNAVALIGGDGADPQPDGVPGYEIPPAAIRLADPKALWVPAPPHPTWWDQVHGVVTLGNDVYVLGGYQPNRFLRCAFDDNLLPTCVELAQIGHEQARVATFAIPAGTCGHEDGAILVLDSPDGEPKGHPAHVYDVKTGSWTLVPRPEGVSREHTVVTVLADGRVLFTGGVVPDSGTTKSVRETEIFDGTSFSRGPSLGTGRQFHGATLLPDGTVLLVGGYGDDPTFPDAEIVDVAKGTSAYLTGPAAALGGPSYAAASGRVGPCAYASLGGRSKGGDDNPNPFDVYDLATGKISSLPGMGLANRTEYAATVTLPDGSLVIAGGSTVNDGGDGKLTAAYRVTY